MRYSFHGKVRASGQQVDGFVEAANATEAIDRLADRGIIGVYSVRPEPKPNKNAVYLSGEAEPPDQEQRRQQPRLPGKPAVVPKRIVSEPAAKQATAAPAPSHVTVSSPATEAMLTQVLERLNALAARVEQALARPMSVTYQSGTVRGGAGAHGNAAKKSTRIPMEVQSSTLHDIFQNNLDLRKSLDKLASTVGPAPGKAAPETVATVLSSTPANGQLISLASAPQTVPQAPAAPREVASVREPVRELPKPAREPKLVVQAQPA